MYNPTNIKGLIIEAAPADIVDLGIGQLPQQYGAIPAPTRMLKENIFKLIFPGYEKYSIPAVDEIKNIQNRNLPVLIIHSKQDQVVHIRSAWQLYKAFKDNGFEHVYLYEIPEGKHSDAIYHETHKHTYLQVVHSFCKKYNFPHTKEHASFDNMDDFKPTLEKITRKLNKDTQQRHRDQWTKISLATMGLAAYFSYKK